MDDFKVCTQLLRTGRKRSVGRSIGGGTQAGMRVPVPYGYVDQTGRERKKKGRVRDVNFRQNILHT